MASQGGGIIRRARSLPRHGEEGQGDIERREQSTSADYCYWWLISGISGGEASLGVPAVSRDMEKRGKEMYKGESKVYQPNIV